MNTDKRTLDRETRKNTQTHTYTISNKHPRNIIIHITYTDRDTETLNQRLTLRFKYWDIHIDITSTSQTPTHIQNT